MDSRPRDAYAVSRDRGLEIFIDDTVDIQYQSLQNNYRSVAIVQP